jgi:hypothetical protein
MAYVKEEDFKKQFRLQQSIGGLLGTAGGVNGTGLSPATVAPIQSGTNQSQLGSSYQNTQANLSGQNALLAALKNQNGLSDQTAASIQQYNLAKQLNAQNAVGNQANALNQTQGLANQLAGAGGVQNLGGALASQQALANQQQGLINQQQNTAGQLQGIANGTGPNPAMAALNQTTGQNVANQASLMAGQRGASSNVGLLARQAAQQGAATQQQAVGQGATMQAQQELGALSGLTTQQQAIGNTQQAIGGTNQSVANIASQQIGQQQSQQQALASQAQAQLAAQQAALGNFGNTSNTLAGQQIAQTQANTSAQQNEQSILQNALAGSNSQYVGAQNSVNSANSGLANTTMLGTQKGIGGLFSGSSSAAGAAGGARGGMVKEYAHGGQASIPQVIPAPMPIAQGPQSSIGRYLNRPKTAAKGGIASQHDYRFGGNVKAKKPEEKAVKAGNSYSNDKIPAVLSEGEVVIPRSIMQSKDPARASADFVSKVLAKRKAS